MKRLYSHVDVRVRDRERAKAFYDAVFAPLGMTAEVGKNFTTYTLNPSDPESEQMWFGFTQDAATRTGDARLALAAETRAAVDAVAAAARAAGALALEGPALETDYSPAYYAVFFEDPDGNKLEVCCLAAP